MFTNEFLDELADGLARRLSHRLERAAGAARPRLLSQENAGVYLGVSRPTVTALIKDGKLHPVRITPGRVLLDIRELDSFIEGRTGIECSA